MKCCAISLFCFQLALLCGAPGLGKTTLAHIVAQHAGYRVVEINARLVLVYLSFFKVHGCTPN